MSDQDEKIRDQVRSQVREQLLADIQSSLDDAVVEARKHGKVFTEDHRKAALVGFVQGCFAACAEATPFIPYLHLVVLGACLFASERNLTPSEESFHETLHKLADMFPDGALPPGIMVVGNPNDLSGMPEGLKDAINKVLGEVLGVNQPAPEDLN